MAYENKLISANELAEKVMSATMYINGVRNGKTLVKEFLEKYRNCVIRMICEAPTVDAVEVVHGRWAVSRESEISKTVWCTACGEEIYIHKNDTLKIDRMPYCPNCGAKMDGDGNG